MAFTLESAVAASTAFYILVHSLGLSLPVATELHTGADLLGRSNAAVQEEESFYSQGYYHYGEYDLPQSEGSPQRMVELLSLSHDVTRLLRND